MSGETVPFKPYLTSDSVMSNLTGGEEAFCLLQILDYFCTFLQATNIATAVSRIVMSWLKDGHQLLQSVE
jgi:hypothetical protein